MSEPKESLRSIFNQAVEILDAAKRAAYLERACGPDAALRQRVDALLHAHQQAGGFLDTAQSGSAPNTVVLNLPPSEKPGDRIGRYRLLQQIGEGGCGVVYMAEQQEPVSRRVAIKVIKLGMDTKAVVARFEAERQALAMMEHPNIAKVLDAGATETGRPFFVMELVRGIRITEYCDQNKLSTDERLGLFTQVCNAIQHAHQKGIIHRDIKPSNILVTLHDGVPVPKVIDFGIAKATQGRLTDQTLFTAFEQFIGTPAYMSPEQAEMSGLDIDTRCDVYALGVLLYELLTGQTPFDARELLASGLDKMRQTIREQEPERPSTRLRTMLNAERTITADRCRTDAPRLIHLLRGDLDWIVMKALEKDRTRRFETASALAKDVQRYLRNEPVEARPSGGLYRFQKLVRRNKTAFAAIGAGIAALVIGLVLSLYLYVQERSALKQTAAAQQAEAQLRQRAEQSAAWSQQIARAGLLLMQARYDESEQVIREIPPHDTLVPFYNVFGGIHARRGQWQEALTNWNRVVEYAPEDHVGYFHLAPLLLQVGDVEGYQRCRSTILRHFADTRDPRIAERMLDVSLILPPSASESAAIAKMAQIAGQADTNSETWGFNLLAKGFAEYRLGHYATAAELLQKVIPLDIGEHCRTEAYLVLAMAQFQLGRRDESRTTLDKAADGVKQLPKAGHLSEEWNHWSIIQVLMREAKALIEGRTESGTETK